jgi:hypothetical protein
MGTKNNPGKYDCYANAEPDEPMFTLLARDPAAPQVIAYWTQLRAEMIELKLKPQSDYEMLDEAVKCASEMQAWRMNRRHG